MFEIYPVFLTQIISRQQKNADAKVALLISRRQKWNSHRQISKNCSFPKGVVNRLPPFKNLSGWPRPLSYRNQSINLLCKLMDWFLYDNGLRHEKVKKQTSKNVPVTTFKKEKLNVLKKLKNGNLKSVCVGYLNLI